VAVTRRIVWRGGGEPVIEGSAVEMARDTPRLSRDELLAFVRGARVLVSMYHDKVDAELLDSAGEQLLGVCNYAVGYENIDIAECARRGVKVTNTPDVVTEGTANLAMALMLAVARRVVEGDRFARSAAYHESGGLSMSSFMGRHLAGQTLLIVGAGRIGRAVAMRAQAFGMRTLYVARGRHLDFEQAPLAARRVELEEGLRLADVVSLHTPLTPQTRHLLNADRLALLKPTAIVVNTARGPVIDEAALARTLKEKRIWGAGLDVFEFEPKVSESLIGLENVVLTPHIGSAEGYWREEMTSMAFENAKAILEGRDPPNRIA